MNSWSKNTWQSRWGAASWYSGRALNRKTEIIDPSPILVPKWLSGHRSSYSISLSLSFLVLGLVKTISKFYSNPKILWFWQVAPFKILYTDSHTHKCPEFNITKIPSNLHFNCSRVKRKTQDVNTFSLCKFYLPLITKYMKAPREPYIYNFWLPATGLQCQTLKIIEHAEIRALKINLLTANEGLSGMQFF